VFGAGALAGAMLFGAAATAAAEPPPPQPNCTAADMAFVATGVSQATTDYLFAHPDVNAFLTTLKGQPKDQIRRQVDTYLDANPQVRTDFQGIRQPMTDFRTRCA
jgi:hemophore-related protein